MSKITPIIAAIDRDYFNGFFHQVYYNKFRKDFFHGKKAVVLREPLYDMIMMQSDRHENGFGVFCAYDFAVRLLAIENYYGLNDFGFELYKKMHTLGGNYGQVNEQEAYYERQRKKGGKKHKTFSYDNQKTEQHSIEQFKKLIESVEKNGYRSDSYVMGDQNLLSINGSHRIALALYTQQEMINVEVYKKLTRRRFSMDFFWEKGFTPEEISIIEKRMNKLLSDCYERIGNYYCILFPPAEKYFDDIVNDIKLMDEDNIKVVGFDDYCWETADFVGFLKGVYHFDSINHTNFMRKVFYILRSSNIVDGKVNFRIVKLNIKDPMYRLKKDNGMPESVATVRLKKMIRERYKSKEKAFTAHYVGDYAHDVIIHSSDNYLSNKAFRTLMGVNRDLTEVVSCLDDYDYAFAIGSEDKISRDYPRNFYFDEDFDIFVKASEVNKIADKLYNGCIKKFEPYGFDVKREESPHGKRVRVLFNGFTVTMFDLMTRMTNLKDGAVEDFIKTAHLESVSVIGEEGEYAYRLAKYLVNPLKSYHKEYLVENKHNVNMERVLSFINDSDVRRAKKLIDSLEENV